MSVPKVLIVEDDGAIRTLMVSALRREPLDVHAAHDGLMALELVRTHEYAVILLDLMMPRLNGFQFLESLESARPGANPVIIVMTAFDGTALKMLRPNRVHAVLNKPFDIERVVEMVHDCADLHRERTEGRMPPPSEDELGPQSVC